MSKEQEQFEKMTTEPIPRLIISLAIPTIISMMITAIYNTADTYFVSKIGTSATGAVGIVFSLMAIIQAIGFTLGMGSGSNISRLLGKQNNTEATVIASTGFFSAVAVGILFSFFGIMFMDKLMILLGSTKTILPYARDYAKYILFGAPIMCPALLLNNVLRAQGKAAFAMVGITTGGILNMILDPIFIFKFGLGISGAAIATLVSQCVSFSILFSFYLRGKTIAKINPFMISKRLSVYLLIIKTGLPSLSRQGLASIAAATLNTMAGGYGDAAVAAMSIVTKIFLLINSVMVGFGQGYQPVVGFNYGAQKYDRVKEGFWFEVKTGLGFMAILSLLGFLLSEQIIGAFNKADPIVLKIGIVALRAQCVTLILAPVIVISNMMLQSAGKAWQATLIAASKQGIYFLPLILILPKIFGLAGVQFTQPIADTATFLTCIPLLKKFFKEITQ